MKSRYSNFTYLMLFVLQLFVVNSVLAQAPPPPPPPPPPPEAGAVKAAGPSDDASSAEVDYELFLEPYNYDPSGRRDPFLRISELEALPQMIQTGGQQRPLLPLERYDLKDIKLIGIIWDADSPRAMFMDPSNQVHILSKDQRIGRNQGYIAVIRESEVVVVETTEKNGEPVYSTKVIRIIR